MARTPVLSQPIWCQGSLAERAWKVGAEVASHYAAEVDRDARHPAEAVAAMREVGLLSAMIPVEFGGEGASMTDVALATRALGFHCTASALVFGMHQIVVGYLQMFADTDGLRDLLRQTAEHELLLANANSEVGIGGDLTRSIASIEPLENGRFRLEKDSLAVSYGEAADAILLIVRRAPDSEPNDQVLVALRPGTYTLESLSQWDTVGLRGTCSGGYKVVAEGDNDMIFSASWSTISTYLLPATAFLLNSAYLGVAEYAAATAHAFVRAAARREVGAIPLTAPLLAELVVEMEQLRGQMDSALVHFESMLAQDRLEDPGLILQLRALKPSITKGAIDAVVKASMICGLQGYSRQSPYCLDRQLRDVLGGPLMAHNLRLLADNTQLLLALKRF